MRERGEGLNPFFEPVESWGNSGPIRAAPPLHLWKTCHKPARFYLLENTENSKNLLEKVSPKKSLIYSKKSERKYDRNMKFRGLKTEFPAT